MFSKFHILGVCLKIYRMLLVTSYPVRFICAEVICLHLWSTFFTFGLRYFNHYRICFSLTHYWNTITLFNLLMFMSEEFLLMCLFSIKFQIFLPAITKIITCISTSNLEADGTSMYWKEYTEHNFYFYINQLDVSRATD